MARTVQRSKMFQTNISIYSTKTFIYNQFMDPIPFSKKFYYEDFFSAVCRSLEGVKYTLNIYRLWYETCNGLMLDGLSREHIPKGGQRVIAMKNTHN